MALLILVIIVPLVFWIIKKSAFKQLTDEEKQIYADARDKALDKDIGKKRKLFPLIGFLGYIVIMVLVTVIVFSINSKPEKNVESQNIDYSLSTRVVIDDFWACIFTSTQIYIAAYVVARIVYEAIVKNKLYKLEDATEQEKKLLARFYVQPISKFIFIGALAEFIPTMIKSITQITMDKPIIYIYPEKKQKVSISLDKPGNLIHSYPKYNNGWTVEADVDGTLIDDNGKRYYSLYWEGISYAKVNEKIGFCVKGGDTAKFLEEKLVLMGLNYKEAEEFIVYWLPQMENNKYNYLYFVQNDGVNTMMRLDIEPKPETLIRIMMYFKPLNKEIKLQEQQLVSTERKGYTVVEWGGSKIK